MTKQDEKEASFSLIVATPEEGFQLAIAHFQTIAAANNYWRDGH